MIQICDDQLIFLLLLLVSVVSCETKEILTFTAHERGTVEIKCPYESRYKEYEKYLCRGECPILNKDKVIESGSSAGDERFSLTDDRTAHIFTVTITDLRTEDRGQYWCGIKTGLLKLDDSKEVHLDIKHEEDSGIYWCGAAQRGQEHKNKWLSVIDLNVSAGTSESASPKPTTTTTTASCHTSKAKTQDTSSSRPVTSSTSPSSTSPSVSMFFSHNEVSPKPQPGLTPIIIMVMVLGILTGFGLSFFIYLRWRQKKEGTQCTDVAHGPSKNPPGGDMRETREADCVYEDICSTLDHPDYSLVLPACAEHDDSVYALATLPSSPSVEINYSSIRFTAAHHSDRTSDGLETCVYTTVRP
ncbi:CMRF35-like molecule 9 isoform X10 [Carassius gibelio]|uniref:CMRF35-like molecule 9 isoform X10 n=1 Tax=Carassius gibelio TaxID=101364 RepID=UPI00227990FD|nr:CMRF35-like molecule 9 isoform X10 [Carassius gibelio]